MAFLQPAEVHTLLGDSFFMFTDLLTCHNAVSFDLEVCQGLAFKFSGQTGQQKQGALLGPLGGGYLEALHISAHLPITGLHLKRLYLAAFILGSEVTGHPNHIEDCTRRMQQDGGRSPPAGSGS